MSQETENYLGSGPTLSLSVDAQPKGHLRLLPYTNIRVYINRHCLPSVNLSEAGLLFALNRPLYIHSNPRLF